MSSFMDLTGRRVKRLAESLSRDPETDCVIRIPAGTQGTVLDSWPAGAGCSAPRK